MYRGYPSFSRRGKILFWATLTVSLAGLAVAVAGGVCIEVYGEIDWTVALFVAGAATMLLPLAGMVAIGVWERKRYVGEEDSAAAEVSENTYYAGGTLVTFTDEGIRIAREEGEAFEEGETYVPYADVAVFRTFERRAPESRGKSLCVLQVPARYFGDETDEGFANCSLHESGRLDATLKKFSVAQKDFRSVPATPVKKLPRKTIRSCINARVCVAIGIVAAAVFLGLLALAAVCWAGRMEGGVHGGFVVLAADIFVTGVILGALYFTQRNTLVLYDRGIRFLSGFFGGAFILWEQIEKIERFGEAPHAAVIFDLGYMVVGFADKKELYLFLRETFPEKCGE